MFACTRRSIYGKRRVKIQIEGKPLLRFAQVGKCANGSFALVLARARAPPYILAFSWTHDSTYTYLRTSQVYTRRELPAERAVRLTMISRNYACLCSKMMAHFLPWKSYTRAFSSLISHVYFLRLVSIFEIIVRFWIKMDLAKFQCERISLQL